MKKTLLIFSILGSLSFVNAQTNTVAMQEIDVIKVYEKVVEDGYFSAQIYEKLATAYYIKEDFQNAAKWFEKLLATGKIEDPSIYLFYAKSLEALAEPEKAKEYLNIYNEVTES